MYSPARGRTRPSEAPPCAASVRLFSKFTAACLAWGAAWGVPAGGWGRAGRPMPLAGISMVESSHAPPPGAGEERHTRGAEGGHRFGEKGKVETGQRPGEGRAGRPGACAGRLRRRTPVIGPRGGREARGGAGVRVYRRRGWAVWGASDSADATEARVARTRTLAS